MKQDARAITVKDIMTKAVITIDVSCTVNQAAKMMEDTKVGSIIVAENNTPVGIITDRDLAIKIVARTYQITESVKRVMSTPLLSISPDETVRIAADLMSTRGVRKLPVIDNDKVIGIITATDLVNQFANCTEDDIRDMYCHTIVKVYEKYSPYA